MTATEEILAELKAFLNHSERAPSIQIVVIPSDLTEK